MSANTALQTINSQTPAVSMPSETEWQIMTQQAKMLVSTNFLPQSIKTPEQAIAIMLQGRELGIPTMTALGTINVIQGKPTVPPQLMLALIERSRQLENIEIITGDNSVSCKMKRKNRSSHTEVFGEKEAKDMGLLAKDNYKKQALTMYKWRAVAACARVVFPDVVLGLYTPDEMGAATDAETGEIITPPAQIHAMPPTKTQLVEKARQSASSPAVFKEPTLDDQLADLCGNLNKAFSTNIWTPKHLTEHARTLFDDDTIESYKSLNDETKNMLIGDLQATLEERLAINSEAIEGEVVEEKDPFSLND